MISRPFNQSLGEKAIISLVMAMTANAMQGDRENT